MLRLNLLEETRFEKVPVTVFPNQGSACKTVARQIAALIIQKQNLNQNAVLGLATGGSPVGIYKELIRLHNEERLSFKNVITFNLDEYYHLHPDAEQSYRSFMNRHLFDHIDIEKNNIYIPPSNLSPEQVPAFCLEYENKIEEVGGIDLQLLGIGRTGHIGFNEPGSAPNSGTRLVTLDELTRSDAALDFGSKENVPLKAITMGIGTILKARRIILVAWDRKKAAIVKKSVEGELNAHVPATYLQLSQEAEVIIDAHAASELKRFNTPWLVKYCRWDAYTIQKAIIWLSRTTGKPILKLTEEDYNNHGMAQLATEKGPVYDLNIQVFNHLQQSITGWPGGKPNADDSRRPERAEPKQKRVLIFAPHPDDDVISMGGTFIRLCDQGHEVHVAYQTSGNTAVWDDEALRFIEFAVDFLKVQAIACPPLNDTYNRIREFILRRQLNEPDLPEVLAIKGLIRKGEAAAGARFVGVKEDCIHFLNLPFYNKAKQAKRISYEEDIECTMALLKKIKPHQVFAAGDFADPHGTHKVCFEIIIQALERLQKEQDWIQQCWVWMYRGAWHEFEIHDIEMAVPLSPQEVRRKRLAIFKHQSQKDVPVFPGEDSREFWVRAEDRTRETALAYNQLGLAEYEAMEAFVRWRLKGSFSLDPTRDLSRDDLLDARDGMSKYDFQMRE